MRGTVRAHVGGSAMGLSGGISDAVKEGIAAGIGTSIIAGGGAVFAFWRKFRKHLHRQESKLVESGERIAALENAYKEDRDFKRIIVKSQMVQTEAMLAMLNGTGKCESCPSYVEASAEPLLKSVSDSKRDMDGYLRGLL